MKSWNFVLYHLLSWRVAHANSIRLHIRTVWRAKSGRPSSIAFVGSSYVPPSTKPSDFWERPILSRNQTGVLPSAGRNHFCQRKTTHSAFYCLIFLSAFLVMGYHTPHGIRNRRKRSVGADRALAVIGIVWRADGRWLEDFLAYPPRGSDTRCSTRTCLSARFGRVRSDSFGVVIVIVDFSRGYREKRVTAKIPNHRRSIGARDDKHSELQVVFDRPCKRLTTYVYIIHACSFWPTNVKKSGDDNIRISGIRRPERRA